MARLKSFGKPSRNESGTLKQPRQTAGPRPETDVRVKKAGHKSEKKHLMGSKLIVKKSQAAAAAVLEPTLKRKAAAVVAPAKKKTADSARPHVTASAKKSKAKAKERAVVKKVASGKASAAAAAADEDDEDDEADLAGNAMVDDRAEESEGDDDDAEEAEAEEEEEDDDDDDDDEEEDVSTADEDETAAAAAGGEPGAKPRRKSYAFHRKQKLRRMQTLQTRGALRFATEEGFRRLSRYAFEAVASRDPSIDLAQIKITRAARAIAQGSVESLMGTILTSAANLALDGKTKAKHNANPRIRPSFVKQVSLIYLGNMPGGRFVNDLRTVCETADADAKLDPQPPAQA